jgi:hypothetical protein
VRGVATVLLPQRPAGSIKAATSHDCQFRWLTGSEYAGRLIAKQRRFGKAAKLTPFPFREATVRMTKACSFLDEASEVCSCAGKWLAVA